MKPFLRWAGSKRQIIPVLSNYWNGNYIRYVEPFAGSACVYFAIGPKRALLGDINKELVLTYNLIKRDVESVKTSLGKLKLGKAEYYKLRSIKPSSLSLSDRAARFIYLNRFCFNGLYRTNRKGIFNVPYGGEKSGRLPSSEQLDEYSCHLQRATVIASDFEKVLLRCKEGDFVYLDPPFSVKAQRTFNEYDAAVFTSNDLLRLRRRLIELAERKIHFVVSYAECEEARILFEGFCARSLVVRRNIAGFAGNRREAKEVVFTNISIVDR